MLTKSSNIAILIYNNPSSWSIISQKYGSRLSVSYLNKMYKNGYIIDRVIKPLNSEMTSVRGGEREGERKKEKLTAFKVYLSPIISI